MYLVDIYDKRIKASVGPQFYVEYNDSKDQLDIAIDSAKKWIDSQSNSEYYSIMYWMIGIL